MGKVIRFFQPYAIAGQVRGIGVGSFGPLDLDRGSPTYGRITATPKPGWSDTDLVGTLGKALRLDVALETDVNAAALGEFRWGASRGFDPSLYLTIGTGIGGGCIKDGKPFHGMLSPEMGHIRIPHDLKEDPFPGCCPFHGDCFEGLASGPAIQERLGVAGESLPDGHPFWKLEAEYIAAALANYILVLSPKKIVLGGGVLQRAYLFPSIRRGVQKYLNNYVQHQYVLQGIDDYIIPPELGNRSGSLGALALAQLQR